MTTIARLTVTLDDVEPEVIRRLEVPFDLRLDRMHLTLQAALGWTDSHLWMVAADDVSWGIPDPDWSDGPLDASKVTLADVIEDTGANTLRYLYDFGDGWEHQIEISDIVDGDPQTNYPTLLDGTGHCPPEDVGGPWGYGDFLEALADPDHEEHDHMIQWAPPNFDPNDAQIEDLKTSVANLAKGWNRKPK